LKMHSNSLESLSKSDFLSFFAEVSKHFKADAFYSGSGGDKSYIFVLPEDVMMVKPDTSKVDIRRFALSDDRLTAGFLSYDYGLDLKKIPSAKDRYMEEGRLCKYGAYVVFDDSVTVYSDNEQLFESLSVIAENFGRFSYDVEPCGIDSNFSEASYINAVENVLENIRSGEVYQLNLSIMFKATVDIDPVLLWCKLADEYPADFYALFHTESGVILSSSPERFLKVSNGEVMTQPIKGTLAFDEYYEGVEAELAESDKESAELSMIVDLMRNDISEFCEVGSVSVDCHKDIFKVDKLLQMYSTVTGRLEEGGDVIDLLVGCFPGGSITGCPKKRAMELIEELEPHARGVYCGSIFVIEDEQNIDSSIAIRTGFYDGEKLRFFAGSGIVIDSEPEKEYHESMSKAEKFFKVFGK